MKNDLRWLIKATKAIKAKYMPRCVYKGIIAVSIDCMYGVEVHCTEDFFHEIADHYETKDCGESEKIYRVVDGVKFFAIRDKEK